MTAPTPTLYAAPARRPGFPPLPDLTRVPTSVALVGLLMLRLALLLVTDGISYAASRAADRPAPLTDALLASNVWIVAVDIVTLVVLAGLLKREGTSLRQLLGRPAGRDWALFLPAFLLMVVAFLASSFIGNLVVYLGPPPRAEAAAVHLPLWYGIWAVTVMPVTIALAEELLYRAYLLPRFQARMGRVIGFLVVGLGFGLQHIAFQVGDWRAMAARAVALTLAGLAIAGMYVWFRRLWPLVLAHWLLDLLFLGLPLLLAAMQG